MKAHLTLLHDLAGIRGIGTAVSESWSFINIEGQYDERLFDVLRKIKTSLQALQITEALKILLDSEAVDIDDLSEYESTPGSFAKWRLNFNKEVLLASKSKNYFVNLFLTESNCAAWLENINPLEEDNKINVYSPLKIIIHDLKKGFGGELLYFLPGNDQSLDTDYKNLLILPSAEKIKEHVHFVTNEKISFNPNTYIIRQYDEKSALCKALIKQSCIVFITCTVNEYYSYDKVVLDGLKRTILKLVDTGDQFDLQFNQNLKDVVKWLYEDRVSTRKKLFNDRFTLETDSAQSLAKSLVVHAIKSLEQAKERYNFVIIERKDAYVKELKDLLKDLRAQSDLYAQKLRNLLNNFLRDALAAIVLIGFTIFTKFSDNLGLEKHDLLEKVFYGLGIYYIVSIAFQAATDWSDILITQKELTYWKRVSKELIPEREFNKYYKESLQTRIRSSYILYPLIALLYVIIIVSCFLYPYVFEQLIIP